MKAVLIEAPGKLEIVDMEKPVPGPRDVVVRVSAGSICGSDVGILKGTNSLASYPALIGHEYGGFIDAAGDRVENVRPGDLVAVDPVRPCGHCQACRKGRQNVCRDVRVTGVHLPGGFAEYVLAPADRVHRVNPDKIPPGLVSLVEPYSIGVQVNHRGRVRKGDRVLVMGCGPAGLAIIEDAKARGAVVVASDILPERLDVARLHGADETVNAGDPDFRKKVLAAGGEDGVPVVVDAACTVHSLPLALDLAAPAGRVVVMGLSDAASAVPAVAITKKELDVMGSRLNNHRFPEVIDGMERGIYRPERLRSHIFPFLRAREAFDLILEHPETVRKVVLDFS